MGQGTAQDFEGKDLKGKFVLSLAPSGLGGIYNRAVAAGAIGVVGISAIGAGDRSTDYPDEIVSTTVNAQPNTAAWAVSPRVARELETMLNRGQKVTIRSITKSEQVPNKQEIVHAEIPGDGSTTQEVAIGGHLFEGYIKQGANDDNSGCALTLEIGRAYLKLIAEGKLPRPKRTINFQWVQEISGTNAWFNAHPDKQKVIIGDLNFDMEGLRLTQSRSYWILQRTPDTFPSYINDIAQSMMEYIAEISRERVRYRRDGYGASQPVESPNGSTDAFYIKIDKHYGSSDHVTYMQHGIPAVMFNHLAGHVVPLLARHAGQAGSHPVQTCSGCRDGGIGRACIRHGRDGCPDSQRKHRPRPGANGRVAHQGAGLYGRCDERDGTDGWLQGSESRHPPSSGSREGRRELRKHFVDKRRQRQAKDGRLCAADRPARRRRC